MYRTKLNMDGQASLAMECDFFRRVYALPLVHSMMIYTTDKYLKAKEYNNLVNKTLGVAEMGVTLATEYAIPMVKKFELPVTVANNIACLALNKVEEKVPLVTMSPEEITNETKKMYNNAIQPAFDKYNDAKTAGALKLEAVKQYGYEKANTLMDTSYGQKVTLVIDAVLTSADQYLDIYLPAQEGDHDEPKFPTDGNAIAKATTVALKFKGRVCNRGMIQLQLLKKRSEELLARLHFIVEMVSLFGVKDSLKIMAPDSALKFKWLEDFLLSPQQYLTQGCLLIGNSCRVQFLQKMELAKQRAYATYEQTASAVSSRVEEAKAKFQKMIESLKDGPEYNPDMTLNEKALAYMRQLVKNLMGQYNNAEQTLRLFPAKILSLFNEAKQNISDLFNTLIKAQSLNDVSLVLLNTFKESLTRLQAIVNRIIEYGLTLKPVTWLVRVEVVTA